MYLQINLIRTKRLINPKKLFTAKLIYVESEKTSTSVKRRILMLQDLLNLEEIPL